MSRIALPFCAVLLPALLGGGCGGLSQPYPTKSSFALQATPPAASAKAPTTQAAAIVGSVNVSRPFDGQGFVYRVGPAQFDTDYYNGFVSPPERLLAGDLSAWLAASNIFAAVG